MTEAQIVLLGEQLKDLHHAVNALRTDTLRMRQQLQKHGRLLNSTRLWRNSLDSNGDLVRDHLHRIMQTLQQPEVEG